MDAYKHHNHCCRFQSGGPLFFSIDGLFGLCRKKAAGKSLREPLHDDRLFKKQAIVDDFVTHYPKCSTEQTLVM